MGLSIADIFMFSEVFEIQEQNKNVTEKNISDRKQTSENRNDIEIEYASVEDTLSMDRNASNETTLISDIPNLIN